MHCLGGIEWHLEDLSGNKRTLILREGDLVFYMPPHQYLISTSQQQITLHYWYKEM